MQVGFMYDTVYVLEGLKKLVLRNYTNKFKTIF